MNLVVVQSEKAFGTVWDILLNDEQSSPVKDKRNSEWKVVEVRAISSLCSY